MDDKIREFAEICRKCVQNGGITSMTLYDAAVPELQKARGKCLMIGGEMVLQLERQWSEGRVTHENIPADEMDQILPRYLPTQFRKAELVTDYGTASLLCSQTGKITLLTKGNIRSGGVNAPMRTAGNDRDKNRLLTGAESFLRALGYIGCKRQSTRQKAGEVPPDLPFYGIHPRRRRKTAEKRDALCGRSLLWKELSQLCRILLHHRCAAS